MHWYRRKNLPCFCICPRRGLYQFKSISCVTVIETFFSRSKASFDPSIEFEMSWFDTESWTNLFQVAVIVVWIMFCWLKVMDTWSKALVTWWPNLFTMISVLISYMGQCGMYAHFSTYFLVYRTILPAKIMQITYLLLLPSEDSCLHV